jgi:nitrogen fixation protein FixH
MNWGKGLMLGMILFMSFILYMVFTLISKSVDLESADYYKKEIEYESEIAQMKNSALLESKVKISKEDGFVVVQLPEDLEVKGSTVEFKRPSNEKKDFLIEKKAEQKIYYPLEKMENGLYNVHVRFQANEKEYLVKTTFYN